MQRDKQLTGGEYYFDKRIASRDGAASRHSHELGEIYYMREGSCVYTAGDEVYELGSLDIIFVPAGVIHSASYGQQPHTRLLLNFPMDEILAGTLLPDGVRLWHVGNAVDRVDAVFDRIEEECAGVDELSCEAVRIRTEELLLLLARNDALAPKNAQRDGIIDATVRFIQSNFSSDVRLSRVAGQLNVSPEHLCRSFKREMGVGFNEYLTDCRLSHAEYMIKNEPGRSVGEIAYACGFNDSNYFSYKFRERYGVPPTKYRGGNKRRG